MKITRSSNGGGSSSNKSMPCIVPWILQMVLLISLSSAMMPLASAQVPTPEFIFPTPTAADLGFEFTDYPNSIWLSKTNEGVACSGYNLDTSSIFVIIWKRNVTNTANPFDYSIRDVVIGGPSSRAYVSAWGIDLLRPLVKIVMSDDLVYLGIGIFNPHSGEASCANVLIYNPSTNLYDEEMNSCTGGRGSSMAMSRNGTWLAITSYDSPDYLNIYKVNIIGGGYDLIQTVFIPPPPPQPSPPGGGYGYGGSVVFNDDASVLVAFGFLTFADLDRSSNFGFVFNRIGDTFVQSAQNSIYCRNSDSTRNAILSTTISGDGSRIFVTSLSYSETITTVCSWSYINATGRYEGNNLFDYEVGTPNQFGMPGSSRPGGITAIATDYTGRLLAISNTRLGHGYDNAYARLTYIYQDSTWTTTKAKGGVWELVGYLEPAEGTVTTTTGVNTVQGGSGWSTNIMLSDASLFVMSQYTGGVVDGNMSSSTVGYLVIYSTGWNTLDTNLLAAEYKGSVGAPADALNYNSYVTASAATKNSDAFVSMGMNITTGASFAIVNVKISYLPVAGDSYFQRGSILDGPPVTRTITSGEDQILPYMAASITTTHHRVVLSASSPTNSSVDSHMYIYAYNSTFDDYVLQNDTTFTVNDTRLGLHIQSRSGEILITGDFPLTNTTVGSVRIFRLKPLAENETDNTSLYFYKQTQTIQPPVPTPWWGGITAIDAYGSILAVAPYAGIDPTIDIYYRNAYNVYIYAQRITIAIEGRVQAMVFAGNGKKLVVNRYFTQAGPTNTWQTVVYSFDESSANWNPSHDFIQGTSNVSTTGMTNGPSVSTCDDGSIISVIRNIANNQTRTYSIYYAQTIPYYPEPLIFIHGQVLPGNLTSSYSGYGVLQGGYGFDKTALSAKGDFLIAGQTDANRVLGEVAVYNMQMYQACVEAVDPYSPICLPPITPPSPPPVTPPFIPPVIPPQIAPISTPPFSPVIAPNYGPSASIPTSPPTAIPFQTEPVSTTSIYFFVMSIAMLFVTGGVALLLVKMLKGRKPNSMGTGSGSKQRKN